MARKMKDSGIEWIGEIPEGWKLTKVKRIFDIGRGRVISQQELEPTGYPVYSSQTKNNGCLGYISTYDFDRSQLTWTTDGINAGTVFLREGKHNCTNVCGTLAPKNDANDLRYLKYALEYIAFYHKRADINGFKIMNNEMAEIELLLPPLFEQQNIANYLDFKCSQIQSILEQSLSSIEEYKKLKQAVITQAVTKGVRGKREMKDSGVEWIGEIPTDWTIQRFARVAEVKSNLVSPDNYLEYPQISPENIEKDSGKLLLPCKTVAEVGVISGNHLFYKGQILYSKIRPKLNKVCIAPFDGLCSADMYPIESKNDTRYIMYCILSNGFLQQVSMITENRVKMPKINQVELSKILVAMPCFLAEEKEIADYLDVKCAEIDGLIAKKEQLVKELESYKKSLIYEVVTGKREV